jgi:ceramide glucosyltransferase
MATILGLALLVASVVGLVLSAVEVIALGAHLAEVPPRPAAPPSGPGGMPAISLLKPLRGVDDDLSRNLESFAALDYPAYEVLLGVGNPDDPAHPVAQAAAARWPERFRVVLREGEPGMNPKVNQLLTLVRRARHDLLVVSDSNVRVAADYLGEIAAHLHDPEVGMVTHLIAGVGEQRAGSLMENLHLAGFVAPGIVAAKRVAGRDVVMGKSMALRRADLAALGGFESVQDVLAEDFVLGARVRAELGKRVVIARRPIEDVSRSKDVAAFFARCRRWTVLQRQLVGGGLYAFQVLLNPVFLAALAQPLAPGPEALAVLAAACLGRALLHGRAGRLLRPGGFGPVQLAAVPLKDLIFGLAWVAAFFEDRVDWRGHRLRVLRGSRLERPPEVDPAG